VVLDFDALRFVRLRRSPQPNDKPVVLLPKDQLSSAATNGIDCQVPAVECHRGDGISVCDEANDYFPRNALAGKVRLNLDVVVDDINRASASRGLS
jgi:hypothetical protein